MIFLDTETARFREDVPDPAPELVCVQQDGARCKPPLLGADAGAELVADLLDHGDTVCVHNFPFDFGVLTRHSPDLLPRFLTAARDGRLYDTGNAVKLADIAAGYGRPGKKPYSLASLCTAFGVHEKRDPQGWRLRFGELRGLPLDSWPRAAVEYATGDTQCLRELWERAAPPALQAQTARQTAYAVALQCLTLRGVQVDQAAVDVLERNAFAARLDKLRQLEAAGIVKRGGGKRMIEIRKRVAAAYAGDEIPRAEKGAVSTERKVLAQSGDPDLMLLASVGFDEKLLTQYVPALKNRRGAICPSYGVLKRSGRTSAYNPNVQNFPRQSGARECIVARPGCVLVSLDYHQIELCSFAQTCLDEGIPSPTAVALNAGEDLHARTASILLGCAYDPANPEHKRWRQIAKAPNFGRPGGMGPRRLLQVLAKEGTKISLAEAKRLIDAHTRAFPDVDAYLRWAEAEHVAGRAAVVRGSGRVRRSSSWLSEANTRFQGRAADGCLSALLDVVCACYVPGGELYGARAWPVIFVHDEIVLEVAEEEAAEVEGIAKRIMLSAMARVLPDVLCKVEGHNGKRWGK